MKIKQCFIQSLLLLVVLSPITLRAQFGGSYSEGPFYFDYDGGFAFCDGYSGNGGSITIPSTITVSDPFGTPGYSQTFDVTSIGSFTFANSGITSVSIDPQPSGGLIEDPFGFVEIGNEAFAGCTNLTSFSIPPPLEELGDGCFMGCTSLSTVTFPENPYFTSIPNSLFNGCISLNNIEIPNTVTNIGDSAFLGCASLASISIPDSVTSIRPFAFSGCKNLDSIKLPENITSIEVGTFSGCTSLTNIIIPEGVTNIGAEAFFGCTNLSSIMIPYSVTSIGSSAFADCSNLTIVCFEGDAPTDGGAIFSGDPVQTILYADGTGGWEATYDGITTMPCDACIGQLVTTLAAMNIGNSSATLNGKIIPNGFAAMFYFQYGTDRTYGNTTASRNLGAGTNGSISFSANISSLAPNTVYHYRAVSVSEGGTFYGIDRTITTAPSVLTLANLSNDAYNQVPGGYSGPPAYHFTGGYNQYVGSNAPSGFSVNAYSSADNSQIIIAFRGTVPAFNQTGFFNLYSDWGFGTGIPTAELQLYTSAAAQFVESVQQKNTNANLTLTGHSLGGALAQLVGNASGLTTKVFNAPGTASLYPALQLFLFYNWPTLPTIANPNTNYRMDGDVASLAGQNFPSVITIATIPNPLPPVVGSDFLYLLSNLNIILSEHSIATVISQIQNGSPQTSAIVSSDADLLPIVENDAVQPFSTSSANPDQTVYNFNFSVNSSSGVLINPGQCSGDDFVFSVTTPSGVAAIDLPPMEGVKSYDVRSESGGSWSTYQSVPPGVLLPFDPVQGVEFVPVDDGGNAIIISNFVYGVYFASSGSVSASLLQKPRESSLSADPTFPIQIIAQPQSQIVVPGSTATFTISTTGGEPLTYCWLKNSTNLSDGGNISGSATASLTINNVSFADFGTYAVVVSNLAGAVSSTGALLQVSLTQNGDFETGDFTGWEINGDDTFTFVDDGSVSGIIPYSGNYEALLGTFNAMGFLSQTIPTCPGVNYVLSFWLSNPNEDPNLFQVSWNGNLIFNETNIIADAWTNVQLFIPATETASTLEFGFEDNFDWIALDQISLIPINEVVPASVTGASVSGANLILSGINGISGEKYCLLTSTNIMKPLNLWTPMAVNTLANSGNFSIMVTNAVNPSVSQKFYIFRQQ